MIRSLVQTIVQSSVAVAPALLSNHSAISNSLSVASALHSNNKSSTPDISMTGSILSPNTVCVADEVHPLGSFTVYVTSIEEQSSGIITVAVNPFPLSVTPSPENTPPETVAANVICVPGHWS